MAKRKNEDQSEKTATEQQDDLNRDVGQRETQDTDRRTQPEVQQNDSPGEGNLTETQRVRLQEERGGTRSDPDRPQPEAAPQQAQPWDLNNPESIPSNEGDDAFGGPSSVQPGSDEDEHERVAKLDSANQVPDSSANTATSTAEAENPDEQKK